MKHSIELPPSVSSDWDMSRLFDILDKISSLEDWYYQVGVIGATDKICKIKRAGALDSNYTWAQAAHPNNIKIAIVNCINQWLQQFEKD